MNSETSAKKFRTPTFLHLILIIWQQVSGLYLIIHSWLITYNLNQFRLGWMWALLINEVIIRNRVNFKLNITQTAIHIILLYICTIEYIICFDNFRQSRHHVNVKKNFLRNIITLVFHLVRFFIIHYIVIYYKHIVFNSIYLSI